LPSDPYSQLVRYKQWADRGLYDVVGQNLDSLNAEDATNILRLLDHIHVVDKVFRHLLRGLPHGFEAISASFPPTESDLFSC
jgi:uncharacterized damage-inducible protein DinB